MLKGGGGDKFGGGGIKRVLRDRVFSREWGKRGRGKKEGKEGGRE